jgi:hypothetical protein
MKQRRPAGNNDSDDFRQLVALLLLLLLLLAPAPPVCLCLAESAELHAPSERPAGQEARRRQLACCC